MPFLLCGLIGNGNRRSSIDSIQSCHCHQDARALSAFVENTRVCWHGRSFTANYGTWLSLSLHVNVTCVFLHVLKIEKRTEAYQFRAKRKRGNGQAAGKANAEEKNEELAADSNVDTEATRKRVKRSVHFKRTRQLARQCFWYAGIFYFIWVPLTMRALWVVSVCIVCLPIKSLSQQSQWIDCSNNHCGCRRRRFWHYSGCRHYCTPPGFAGISSLPGSQVSETDARESGCGRLWLVQEYAGVATTFSSQFVSTGGHAHSTDSQEPWLLGLWWCKGGNEVKLAQYTCLHFILVEI